MKAAVDRSVRVSLACSALSLVAFAVGCAGKPKQDDAMLEKYPQCYHKNLKIQAKCFQKNEAGDKTTAMELENTAYPGQYK